MTNAEKIRKMSDSDLADFLCDVSGTKCAACKFNGGERVHVFEEECAVMKWLREEAKENG